LGGVFISYRREDSGGFAGRIYDRLTNKLGRENVFFDVDAIPPGLDFVDVLSDRVGKCDALVAVIGKHWVASADSQNRRRLDDPSDFVRVEIEAALQRNVPVIPVLVDGAAMPQPDDLPTGMKTLTRRQGIEISHARFDSDVERLTRALSTLENELLRGEAAERVAREEGEKRRAAAESGKRPSVMAVQVQSAGHAADPVIERSPASAPVHTFETPGPRRSVRSRLIVGAVTSAVAVGAATLLLEYGSRRISSVKEVEYVEYDVDRRGSDYNKFDLAQPDPALCQASCNGEAQCKAWTFVKVGFQGPKARCWLKNAVPPATPNACCVSGFKDTSPG